MAKRLSIIDELFKKGLVTPSEQQAPDLGEQAVEPVNVLSGVEEQVDVLRALVDPKTCRLWEHADRPLNETDHAADIADTMKSVGQLSPVIARPFRDPNAPELKFEIIAGQVRWRAALQAGVELDVIIRNVSDREAFELMVIENEQRRDLSDYAKAVRFKRALESKFYANKVELGNRWKLKPADVSRLLAFCELDAEVRDAIPNLRDISGRRGYEIVRAISHGYKARVLRDAARLHDLPANLIDYYQANPEVTDSVGTTPNLPHAAKDQESSAQVGSVSGFKGRGPTTAVKYATADGRYLFSLRQGRSETAPTVIAFSTLSASLARRAEFIEEFRTLVEKHIGFVEPPP